MNRKIKFLVKFISINLLCLKPTLCLSMEDQICNKIINMLLNKENLTHKLLTGPVTTWYLKEILQEIHKKMSSSENMDMLSNFNCIGFMTVNKILDIFRPFLENYINAYKKDKEKNRNVEQRIRTYFQFEHIYLNDTEKGNDNYKFFIKWTNNSSIYYDRMHRIVEYIIRNIDAISPNRTINLSSPNENKIKICII